jgi:hypothetical protein
MKSNSFFAELKRRDVYKVAVAYAVVAWLLIQAGSILLPTFDAPAWVLKAFLVFVGLGFILSVIISWVFEMTPEGIKRTADISPDEGTDIVQQLQAQARQQFVRGYLFALVQAGLSDRTTAMDYLERDYRNHDNIGIRVDPLPGDPRFKTLGDKTPAITRPARLLQGIEPPNIDNTVTGQVGVISEDAAKVKPDLAVREKDGDELHAFNAMLLNELLKEHLTVQGAPAEA